VETRSFQGTVKGKHPVPEEGVQGSLPL